MSIEIAIRSYRRADILSQKTLPYVLDGGVSPDQITLFVANDHEESRYRQQVGHLVDRYVQTGVGAREAFNGVIDHYGEGDRVLMLDDDLDAIVCKTGENSTKMVGDIPAMAREGFRFARRAGSPVWGVYPTHNAFFMRRGVDIGLRKLCHATLGFTVREGLPRIELSEMHEQEWSIKCWEAYGKVVRLAYYAPKTTAFRYSGGLQAHDRADMRKQCLDSLCERWPGLVSRDTHEASGMVDANLRQMPPTDV